MFFIQQETLILKTGAQKSRYTVPANPVPYVLPIVVMTISGGGLGLKQKLRLLEYCIIFVQSAIFSLVIFVYFG